MKDNAMTDASILRFQSYFDIGNHAIAFIGSTVNGKEQVYVDEALVSEKRSFGLKSSHKFIVEGKPYTIAVKVKNVFSGKFEIQLYQGSTLIDEDSIHHLHSSLQGGMKLWAPLLAVGILFGIAVGYVIGRILPYFW